MLRNRAIVRGGRRASREIKSRLAQAGKLSLTVGIHSTDAVSYPGEELHTAQVMAFHEFGAGNVPERSWLRKPLDRARKSLARFMSRTLKRVTSDQITGVIASGIVGEWVVNRVIRKAITDGIAPPLADATMRRKGSSQPLIDTGQALASIGYEVQ